MTIETLSGTSGDDSLHATSGTNRNWSIDGLAGTDYLVGSGRSDTLNGGDDDDVLADGPGEASGADILVGGSGEGFKLKIAVLENHAALTATDILVA